MRSLDGIAFVDPRASEIDIVQAVGRVMRTSPETGKALGTVIIPVATAFGADADAILENSTFSVVWSVVKALRAHDEEFGATLDRLRAEVGRSGASPELSEHVALRLGAQVDEAFVRRLWVRMVESATSSWDASYGCLLAFVDREGHAGVPADWAEDGMPLGQWVAKQRHVRKRGVLGSDRVSRLEALPGWSWDCPAEQWEGSFLTLAHYVEREGHARVPTGHVEDGRALGQWVYQQRHKRNRGALDLDRVARFEALPGWSWGRGGSQAARWDEGLKTLERYAAREGHAWVPANRLEDGTALGQWVLEQRQARSAGTLRSARVSRLERVPGWSWDVEENDWESSFAALVRYIDREGRANVPVDWVEEGMPLGWWAYQQRHAGFRDALSSDRVARLAALRGWSWYVVSERWEESFATLLSYVEREGTADVPLGHIEDAEALGVWVRTQRYARNLGALSPDCVSRLEVLPGWSWDLATPQWEESFGTLQRYVDREGHARVTADHVEDGMRLGRWVYAQRHAGKRGTLSPECVSRLEKLPGWSWDLQSEQWDASFAVLQRYVDREGHARVPTAHVEDGTPLGMWAAKQRHLHRRGTLGADRVARLRALPDWTWDLRDRRGDRRA